MVASTADIAEVVAVDVTPLVVAGVVTVGVASLADAGVVTVGVAFLADAGVASPADLAGVCHHRCGILGRCWGGVPGRWRPRPTLLGLPL